MPAAPSVALLGLGPWGQNHLRVLSELGVLAGVFDPHSAVYPRTLDPALRAASVQELLSRPGIRSVVIATPARTHAELTRTVLMRGLDVFVEKPLTLDVAEAEALVAMARSRRAILMVGHITLYHPAIVALKRLVDQGTLGQLRYLYANRLNLGTVREEEDILWSFAPHDIAVFLHLIQATPVFVRAFGGSYLRAGRADVTVTHLHFPNDVRGHIFVSWLHPMKEHRLVVIGDRRMAVFSDGREGGELLVFEAGAALGSELNVAARGHGERVAFEPKEPLRAELEHFLHAVNERVEPLSDGEHGLSVLRILESAHASLAKTETPFRSASVEEIP